MPKTNFTKVEEVLDQGLRKYEVQHLLEAADEVSGGVKKGRNPSISYTGEPSQPKPSPLSKDQALLIKSLKRDLVRFQKKGSSFYNLLGLSKADLTKMVDTPTILTPAEWETIQQFRTKLDQYKADLLKKLPKETNEDLVEKERKDHINRRYNVNKKWLPLT